MDIQYAILGLLSWRSFSGYDLKKIISESELFYWSGNNNQIYHSLISLHKEGLVTHQIQQQESLPAKKIYSITDQGRAALHKWLLSNPELPELHYNFLIQLAWTEPLSGAELDSLLDRYEDEIAVQLRMRQVRATQPGTVPDRSPREQFLWERINEHLTAAYQHELDWVQKLHQDLKGEDLSAPG